jgi:hypothetical protein
LFFAGGGSGGWAIKTGGNPTRKLAILGAALTLCVVTAPPLVTQAQDAQIAALLQN